MFVTALVPINLACNYRTRHKMACLLVLCGSLQLDTGGDYLGSRFSAISGCLDSGLAVCGGAEEVRKIKGDGKRFMQYVVTSDAVCMDAVETKLLAIEVFMNS